MIRRSLRRFLAGMFMLLALLVFWRSFLIVDQTESVHLTQFGRPVRLIEEPGLHFKWPYQSARTFDRRLQLDTPAAREMLTRDKKNLEVAWYVSWRIADVEHFLRTVRTIPEARARLEDMAASVVAAELGLHDLGGLVTVTDHSALEAMIGALTRRIAEQAAREYGLEVVAVRLRRLNYPEEVRAAVFEQIRSERQRVAAATRAEGESQARVIKSAAERERAVSSRWPSPTPPVRSEKVKRSRPHCQRGAGCRSRVLPVPQDTRNLPRCPRFQDHPGALG